MTAQRDNDEIVATTKFKPSKPSLQSTSGKQQQQQRDVVEDWEAENSEDERSAQDPFLTTKQEWSKANKQVPAPVPLVNASARSLPPIAYGQGFSIAPRTHGGAESISPTPTNHGQSAPAPPRILQRPKNILPGVHSDGTNLNKSSSVQDRKTVEQRQEEYRQARARIFGNASSPSDGPSDGAKYNQADIKNHQFSRESSRREPKGK